MSTRKNIDELFKQKLGGQTDQEYNPDAWSRMEKMLDTHLPIDNAAGISGGASSSSGMASAASGAWLTKKWFIAASIITLLSTGSTAIWWWNTDDNTSTPITEQNTAVETPSSLESDENIQAASAELAETTEATDSSDDASLNSINEATLLQTRSSQNLSNSKKSAENSNDFEPSINSSLNAESPQNNTARIERSTPSGSVNAEETGLDDPTTAEALASLATKNTSEINVIAEEEIENSSVEQSIENSASNSTTVAQGEHTTRRAKIDGIELITMPAPQTELVLAEARTEAVIELPKVNQNSVFAVGGINLAQSLETDNSTLSGNEFFGIGYERLVGSRLSVGANLIYQPRSSVGFARKFESVYYNFGKHVETTTITTQRLYYLEMPVYAHYYIGGRHSILGGISANYLLQAKSEVSSNTVNEYTESAQSESSFGYMNGIENWDFALTAGYEFMLSQKLTLGARASYGLTDISKNSYYNNDVFDRNTMLRIMLKYQIFNY